jgi:hypothetical protein
MVTAHKVVVSCINTLVVRCQSTTTLQAFNIKIISKSARLEPCGLGSLSLNSGPPGLEPSLMLIDADPFQGSGSYQKPLSMRRDAITVEGG